MADEEQTEQKQDEEKQDEEKQDDGNGSPEGESDAMEAAKKAKEEEEKAKEKVKELEEDPPEKLEDWPDDKAKYETFGGPEGDESYDESVTGKLGPSSLRHREDGSVEIEGEEVDDPEEYKGDPIPGGPTDPQAKESRAYGEPDLTDETSANVEESSRGEGDGDDDDGDGDDSESGGESGGEESGGGSESGGTEGQ